MNFLVSKPIVLLKRKTSCSGITQSIFPSKLCHFFVSVLTIMKIINIALKNLQGLGTMEVWIRSEIKNLLIDHDLFNFEKTRINKFKKIYSLG
jgi:hypothetical protein